MAGGRPLLLCTFGAAIPPLSRSGNEADPSGEASSSSSISFVSGAPAAVEADAPFCGSSSRTIHSTASAAAVA